MYLLSNLYKGTLLVRDNHTGISGSVKFEFVKRGITFQLCGKGNPKGGGGKTFKGVESLTKEATMPTFIKGSTYPQFYFRIVFLNDHCFKLCFIA